MDGLVIVGFVASVLVATYVQSVTGFAMGMIIIAVIGGSRLMDLPTLTATTSLLNQKRSGRQLKSLAWG